MEVDGITIGQKIYNSPQTLYEIPNHLGKWQHYNAQNVEKASKSGLLRTMHIWV